MLHASATSHTGSLLYVAELLHRVRNEYAKAIATASVMASRSASRETKVVLGEVIEYLTQLAKAHQLLSPPAFEGVADLGDYLARLCNIKVSTELAWRGTSLHLAVSSRIEIDSARCWRAGLIVAELITNAERHGAASGPAKIVVSAYLDANEVVCRVANDSFTTSMFTPGLGTYLVDELAAEIDGRIERRFDEKGVMITLSFPADSEQQNLSYIRQAATKR
jgi:two-component sensor histidine kinase